MICLLDDEYNKALHEILTIMVVIRGLEDIINSEQKILQDLQLKLNNIRMQFIDAVKQEE